MLCVASVWGTTSIVFTGVGFFCANPFSRCLPTATASIYNMAHLLYTQGKLDEAIAYLEEAVQEYTETLGSDHPHTQNAVSGLQMLKSQ